MRVTIFLLIWCFGCFGFSQSNTVFEEANSLYNDGKFAEAIDKYESILDSNFHSAELYFNLANANYKLNNIAPSIYYYEKALQLDPDDDDIKNNLSYAQNMTIDAIDRVPQVGFSRIVNNLIKLMSADAWATTGICGVVLFVLLFIMYHFSYATTKKRLSFIFSIIGLLIGCFALLMAFQKERIDKRDNPAIVFAQESRVKADPNKISEEVFRLHEGTKVQVLEIYKNWKKIKLSDNSTGWIPSNDIRLLSDF